MSDLNNLREEDIKERLETIQREYRDIIDKLLPLLQKASFIEKEISLLVSELESR